MRQDKICYLLLAPEEAGGVHDKAEDDGAGHGAQAADQDRLQAQRQGALHALHRSGRWEGESVYLVQQDRMLSGQCHLQKILQVGMYFEFQMIIIVIKTNTIFKDNYKISP